MIHTDRTVGHATQYKLYTLRVPSRPIIFKIFTKSKTMLLVPLLPIRFKLYTLYNLWVPLRPIIFKMSKLYKTVNTVQAVKPVVGVCCGGKQWFEMMSPNLTHGQTK